MNMTCPIVVFGLTVPIIWEEYSWEDSKSTNVVHPERRNTRHSMMKDQRMPVRLMDAHLLFILPWTVPLHETF